MESKHTKAIAVLAAASILGIILLMYHASNGAVGSTKEKFSIQQSMLAKQIGLAIRKDNQILVKELEFLSHLQTIQDMDINNSREILAEIYNYELQAHSVNDIALLDSNGIIKFTLNSSELIGKDFSFRKYYQKARALKTSTSVYEYIEFRGADPGQKGIIIAMPIFSHEERFSGLVLFTIKANEFVSHLIPSETYNSTFWIFDSSGNIIFHPEYAPGTNIDDMAGGSESFRAFLENIRGQEQYQTEYISPEEGVVIASSYTIKMAGEPWTIVISMPVESFSEIIDRSSTEYALGILLISLIATGIISLSAFYNKALRKSQDELELRVNKRTRDLMAVNEELEKEISDHIKAKTSLRSAKIIADEERAKSEAVIACMGDAISIQSPDFQVLYQNRVHSDIMGNRVGEYCYEAYEGREKVCEGCPMVKAFEDGTIHSAERSALINGSMMYVDITASSLRDSEGNIVGGIEIIRDITKRKLSEEALRKAEEELRSIYNAISGHLTVVDKDFRILTYNNTVERQFGRDLTGRLCYEAYQARDEICPGCAVNETLATGKPAFAFQPATPLSNPVEIYAYPIFDDKGEVAAVVEHGIEVTEKVKIEEALRRSEERYRHLLELAQEGIWVIDKNDITTFVNSSMAFMLGYSVNEMMGRHMFEFMDGGDTEIAEQSLEKRKKGIGEQHDFEFTRKDGSRIYTTVITSPILDENGNYNGAIAGVIDITDRKKAENQLKEAYSHLETLIKAIPYAVFFKDADGRHVVVNEACCNFSGHTKEEMLGKTCFQLLPPDLAEACHKSDEEIMRVRKTLRIDEQITDRDGNKLFLETIKTPLFDENGNVKGLVGLFHDITWRKRIEEDLRRAKESLAEAQQIAKMGNWEWDVATNEVGWSDEVYRIYGQAPYNFTPTYEAVVKSMHPDSLELFLQNINAALNEQKPFEMNYSLLRPDGEERIAHAIGKVTYDSSGKPIKILGTVQDITEKKMLEKEALRSAQLASVGELAAGVAHEINNPINGIINYAQILLNRSLQDGNRDIASRIIKEGDRISDIVRSLLSFARPDREDRMPADVGYLLQEVLTLTKAQLTKEGIMLEIDIPRELPQVKVNWQQMQQVFLNIINNSRYALNEKYPGTAANKALTITARQNKSDGLPYVRITFTDKGTGIPSHLLAKVTTTFFTTKPKGKGTGLGLSISQSIVNSHGGNLSIESKEGEFTKINIDIPVAEEIEERNTASRSTGAQSD